MAFSNSTSAEMAVTEADDTGVQGPLYDEVYLALIPLTNIMRIHGLFPIPTNRDKGLKSVVRNLKFSWSSKLLILSVAALGAIFCWFYFVIWDHATYMYLEYPLEAIAIVLNTIFMSSDAATNLTRMIAQGPKWKFYFEQWQRLDDLLGITLDKKLRIFVKSISVAYTVYATMAFTTVLYAINLKYSNPEGEDFTGDGFVVGLICYGSFLNGCQLLPEILFACICFAIDLRFSAIINKIEKTLKNRPCTTEKRQIAKELEESRIAFKWLMDIVKSTNAIMGPTLLSCVILTSVNMSTFVFMFFYQSLANPAVAFSKVIYSSVCLLRLISICFFADRIKTKLTTFKRVIFLIPAVDLTQRSNQELLLFVTCIKKSTASFTGCEFIAIDKELFNKVVGAILTYTITIFEFYEKQKNYEKDITITTCLEAT